MQIICIKAPVSVQSLNNYFFMNITILYLLSSGLLIVLASLAGVLFVAKKQEAFVSKNLPYLISFSAGVFLFTAGFMTLESYHLFENIWYVLTGVISGYLLAVLLVKALPQMHHHHKDDECNTHTSGRNVLIGDAIHNVADGLILVPAFLVSPLLGIGTAFALFVHEFLQEVSEFFVLKQAGYSTKRALTLNVLVSLAIFIGIGIGLLISETILLQAILLSLSAGFFAYIISHDLFPHEKVTNDKSQAPLHILLLIAGVMLIGGVNYATAGYHSHEHAHTLESDDRDHDADHSTQ